MRQRSRKQTKRANEAYWNSAGKPDAPKPAFAVKAKIRRPKNKPPTKG